MKSRRMFWRIVEAIEEAIARGDYPPGSRLPPERELAERFSVSRPTIREAIIALEVRSKVEVKTGSGVYVLDTAQQEENINRINAFELTQARALIEGEVAALAAATINEQELAKLKETLEMMERGDDVEKADEIFHKTIAGATRNLAMILTVNNLWDLRVSRAQIISDYHAVCSQDDKKTMAEHRAIYEALKARDSNKARSAMHAHFDRLINALFDAEEARSLEEVKRKNSEKRGLYSIKNVVSH